MAIGFLLGDTSKVTEHDTFHIGSNATVTFTCKNKNKKVVAPLSGNLQLTAQSTWTNLVNGTMGGSSWLGIIDAANQILRGRTVQQPWFGRSTWGGTSPMQLQIPVQFISRYDAYLEVYMPALGLLSFVYPRFSKVSTDNSVDQHGQADVFAEYFVPGPSITYSSGDDYTKGGLGGGGDPVEVTVGSFIKFTGCYIENVSLTVENSFNPQGYPHNVKAVVTVKAMDAFFVNKDGSFMKESIGTQDFTLNTVLRSAIDFAQEKFSINLEESATEMDFVGSGGAH